MTNTRRTALTIVLTAASTAVAVLVAAVVTAYSGSVDVSAASHPSGLTRWFLTTTRDHSIAARARDTAVPPLGDSTQLAIGADHYGEMCQTCHGAPGIEPGEAAQGLEPPPPKLPTDLSAAETYWVVKNGIGMTGMPAFGKTHDDQKIWAIVAFVERLDGMTADQYRKAVGGPGHDESDEGQKHAHAGPDDEHVDD